MNSKQRRRMARERKGKVTFTWKENNDPPVSQVLDGIIARFGLPKEADRPKKAFFGLSFNWVMHLVALGKGRRSRAPDLTGF